MNGDVGKYPPQSGGGGSSGGGGNVGYPPTPESPVFPLHNGYIPGEFPYLPDGQIVTGRLRLKSSDGVGSYFAV